MTTPHKIEADVRDAIHAFLHSGALPGPEAVDASLAFMIDGFTGIGTGAGDYYPDRAAFGTLLRREKEQGPYPGTFEVLSMHVRELRPGLALAEGQIRFEIDAGGETHVVEPRCSYLLEHHDGRWLIAHFHFSLANAMQREGDSLIDALDNRNRELEEQVARRTAALEQSLADLHATQSRLVHVEKMASLGRLTAGVGHEIKNPLNFVVNFAALSGELLDELRAEVESAQGRQVGDIAQAINSLLDDLMTNAARIHEHGQRADEIVRGMMEHAGGGSEPLRTVDVNALVEEQVAMAVERFRALPGSPSVDVKREYGASVGRADAAPKGLSRAVAGLVSNALDACAEHAGAQAGGDGASAYEPSITVRTSRPADIVTVEISDNGCGMTEITRAQAFEPFFTTKPAGSGHTGLGLSLVHEVVVEGHGGTLEVTSTEDEGTTFTLSWPAPAHAIPA